MPAGFFDAHAPGPAPQGPEQARDALLARLALPAAPFPQDPFPLDWAALLLAFDEYPRLQLPLYERLLDDYAVAVRARLPNGFLPESEPLRALATLRQAVYEDAGFRGNREQYYDVRNSYLNEVLDRRLGIPISLALVMLGITRRLGWPVHAVNFPQHFLLAWRSPGTVLPLDTFDGLVLGAEEVAERWRLATGDVAPDLNEMLTPAEPSMVLIRVLNNIRVVHTRGRRYRLAAMANEKMALLEPENPYHERDLGLLLLGAGDVAAGVSRLENYLQRAPGGEDVPALRERLAHLRAQLDEG